jgi:uncharacterized delta-60 repeat protein
MTDPRLHFFDHLSGDTEKPWSETWPKVLRFVFRIICVLAHQTGFCYVRKMQEYQGRSLTKGLLSISALLFPLLSPAQSTFRVKEFRLLSESQAELILTGEIGPTYTIEATTNLIKWVSLGEQTPQSLGDTMATLTINLDTDWDSAFFRVSDEPILNLLPLDYAGTIGPAGGVISAQTGRALLDFPPGAVSEDTDIRISPLVNVGVPGVIIPTTFDFGPDGAAFSSPATLTLFYNEEDLPAAIDESTDVFIVGTSHATGELVPVPGSTVDTVANSVSAPISGFSTYAVAISCLPGESLLPWCPPVCIGDPPVFPDDDGGQLDPSFGTAGTFTFELGLPGATGVDDLLVDNLGQLLLAVERTRMGVARILPDATGFDPDFGVEGFAELSPTDPDNTPQSITLRTDGRIILNGAQQPPGRYLYLQIARFMPNGAPDTSFGEAGVMLDQRQPITLQGDLVALPDGGILVLDAGARSLFQYLPDGSPDPSFGAEGIATDSTRFAGSGLLRRATGDFLLARGKDIYEVDAQGNPGILYTNQLVGSYSTVEFEEIPGGGYVLTGRLFAREGLATIWTPFAARFQPGTEPGSLEPDTCFGSDEFEIGYGLRLFDFGGSLLVHSSAIQADGRIILAGATTDRGDDDDMFVIRIRPDGEIDAGFGSDGIVYLDFGGDEAGGSVAIDNQGRIVVAGSSSVGDVFTGMRSGVVARLLP